jgi:hypothetical protein
MAMIKWAALGVLLGLSAFVVILFVFCLLGL